jgi:hypothetical protein
MHLLNKPYEICKSCETLREQLRISNAEKDQLLKSILEFTKPTVVERQEVNIRELTPLKTRALPWRIRAQRLEAESRHEAQVKKLYEERTKQLEKEVGLEDEDAVSGSNAQVQTR